MGNMVRLQVRLAGGLALTAEVSNVENVRDFAEGERVGLSWSESSVVLLRN